MRISLAYVHILAEIRSFASVGLLAWQSHEAVRVRKSLLPAVFVHRLSSFGARRNLQGLQIKLYRRLSLIQTRQSVSAKTERCAPSFKFTRSGNLAFCSIELISMIKLLQNAHSATLAPLYIRSKQADLVQSLQDLPQDEL